jgi:hypothetical protein
MRCVPLAWVYRGVYNIITLIIVFFFCVASVLVSYHIVAEHCRQLQEAWHTLRRGGRRPSR